MPGRQVGMVAVQAAHGEGSHPQRSRHQSCEASHCQKFGSTQHSMMLPMRRPSQGTSRHLRVSSGAQHALVHLVGLCSLYAALIAICIGLGVHDMRQGTVLTNSQRTIVASGCACEACGGA